MSYSVLICRQAARLVVKNIFLFDSCRFITLFTSPSYLLNNNVNKLLFSKSILYFFFIFKIMTSTILKQ